MRDSNAPPCSRRQVCGGGWNFFLPSVRVVGLPCLLTLCLLSTSAAAGERRRADGFTSVYTERSGQLILDRALSAFRSGDAADGVATLQELLDAPSDSFVAAGNLQLGIRASAAEFLRNAPKSIHQFYATTQERRAEAILDEAVAARDVTSLGEVVRRFPGTAAAGRAADCLARLAFDRGDFGTAARLWQQLLVERLEAGGASSDLAAKTIVALRRAGREQRASELTAQFASSPVRIAGRATTVRSLSQGALPSAPRLPTIGIPDSTASGLTPPAFPPTWQQTADGNERRLLELWEGARRSESRPVATPAGTVIIGDQLFVREPSALVSYDLQSGRPLWRAALSGAPHRDAALLEQRPRNLQELTHFEESYAGNSALAAISTDGDHVFIVDRSEAWSSPVQVASRTSLPESRTSSSNATNRLLAFPVDPTVGSEPQPAWLAGGRLNSPESTALAGHYFFGPPVLAGDRLLAVTEERQCLYLSVLVPATGQLLWQQPLGFVARPVDDDRMRAASSTPPAVADGIAVCATNAGFVVAVDFMTGRLLWAYEYVAEGADHGDSAFPSAPLVRDGHVVVLPHDSHRIHCLDLATGSVQWTAPREDAISVACLTETAAVFLGRSSIRSLSTVDGRPLWASRLGAPAGTGIVTDSTYLLPLATGTIAAIDLETGHRTGFDSPRARLTYHPLVEPASESDTSPRWQPGNLCTDGNALFSVNPFGVLRLEAAGAELARNNSPSDLLGQARLELAAGFLEPAREHLEFLRSDANREGMHREATRLLRELHYLVLDNETPATREATLATLDELSITPTERGRFLLRATADPAETTSADALRGRMRELASLSLDEPLPSPDDASHFVSPASWLRELANRRPTDLESMSWPAGLIAAADDADLHAWLLCLPEGRRAAEIRVELARRAIDDAEFHQAEMLLLQAMRSDTVVGDAQRVMEHLQTRSGLNGTTERVSHADLGIGNVRITGKHWTPADDGLVETFQQYRRLMVSRGRNPFRVVDLGDTQQARLTLVDLQRGMRLGEVSIDARLWFPSPGRQPLESHFVPVVTADRVYGLSYLEARNGVPVWETDLAGNSSFLPQIGPYGPSFCAVETRSGLTVLDSATGKTLWRRTDLAINRQASGSRSTRLFGDEDVLVRLGAEDANYTVYQTRTGEVLSQGQLPLSELRQTEAIGRKFFYVETHEDRSTAHLWDPAANSDDLAVTFDGSLLEVPTRDGRLVLLFGDGRLFIVDPHDVQRSIRLDIDPRLASQVSSLQAFSDAERHYVSLAIADPTRFEDGTVTQFVYDTPLAMNHVQGRLIAIDKESGQIVWSRPTGPQSILDPVDHPFPFLVGLARVTHRHDGNRKTLLVEAIDPHTGNTLGRNGALMPDQILQARYEPQNDRVFLAGLTSTVVLDVARDGADRAVARGTSSSE